jgi:hypothetical protein
MPHSAEQDGFKANASYTGVPPSVKRGKMLADSEPFPDLIQRERVFPLRIDHDLPSRT